MARLEQELLGLRQASFNLCQQANVLAFFGQAVAFNKKLDFQQNQFLDLQLLSVGVEVTVPATVFTPTVPDATGNRFFRPFNEINTAFYFNRSLTTNAYRIPKPASYSTPQTSSNYGVSSNDASPWIPFLPPPSFSTITTTHSWQNLTSIPSDPNGEQVVLQIVNRIYNTEAFYKRGDNSGDDVETPIERKESGFQKDHEENPGGPNQTDAGWIDKVPPTIRNVSILKNCGRLELPRRITNDGIFLKCFPKLCKKSG
ncbi:unnamed protein product [Caenorhabditis brenneri]